MGRLDGTSVGRFELTSVGGLVGLVVGGSVGILLGCNETVGKMLDFVVGGILG